MNSKFILLALLLFWIRPTVSALNPYVEKANIYYERAETLFLKDFDNCIVNLKKALPIYKQYQYWTPYVKCLNGLFAAYYQKSDFEMAERFAFTANKIANQYLDSNSETYITAINNLGAFYYYKRAVHQAINTYEIALRNAFKSEVPNSPFTASIYHNISNCQILLGDYDAALENLYRAVAERKKSPLENSLKTAEDYRSIGLCFKEKRRLKKAVKFYHKSLLILSSMASKKGYYIREEEQLLKQKIAQIHLETNRIDSAKHFIYTLINPSDSYSNKPNHFLAYEIMAQIQLKYKNFTKAYFYFQIALDLLEDQSDKSEYQHRKAGILVQLGLASVEQTELKQALDHFQKALQCLTVGFQPKNLSQNPTIQSFTIPLEGIRVLKAKAKTFRTLYTYEQSNAQLIAAIKTYQLASNLIEKCRQTILTSGSKQQLTGAALPIYEGGIQTALELYELSQNTDYLHKAFAFAERNKSILLLESVKEKLARNYGDLPNELKEKEYNLRTDIAFYGQLLQTKTKLPSIPEMPLFKVWQQHLFHLKKEYTQLTRLLEKKHPKYYRLKYATTPVTLNSLQASLDSKTLLVEYFVGEKHIFMLLISKRSVNAFRIRKTNGLKATIRQFADLLKSRHSSKLSFHNYTSLAFDLYNQLLQQGLKTLPGLFNRLIIIPDDILASIPFEALLRKESLNPTQSFHPDYLAYLFEDFSISYSYSSTLFVDNLRQESKKYEEPFLGLAPAFSSGHEESFRHNETNFPAKLKCASSEIDHIHSMIGGTVLKDQEAKLHYFKDFKQSYQIVHFATHAYADMERPNLSKIYFSDQALLNKDIPMLDIPAELAVLSACNTGTGKYVKGEGVMSLSRAFMHAGCPSTLMSLWSVDDCETSKLMLLFYKYLKKGLAKDMALQQAKIEYLCTADKAFQHTFYWSTFVLTGNYLPLDAIRTKRLPRLLIIIGVSAACFLCFRRWKV